MAPIQQLIHESSATHVAQGSVTGARERLIGGEGDGPNWASIAHTTEDLAEIQSTAQAFRASCEHVVLCGTGGSSLSARALIDLVGHPLGLAHAGTPQIHLLDSTEPELLEAIFALPPHKTGWLFISRSGGTLETLVQFLAFMGRDLHRQSPCVRVITLPGDSALRALANHYGIHIMDHRASIGGRYAVLTNVGLLPAAILGMDVLQLRAGAATMLEDAGIAMALKAAHWHMDCICRGYTTHVMLPYSGRLYGWTYWYRQLWAESVGKDGKGSTPLIGLAPLDQHSMLQLLLDGPKDKSITTIEVAPVALATSSHPLLDAELLDRHPPLGFINTLDGGQIIKAQAYGTIHSFINRGLPARELRLKDLSANSIGALFMQQMMETVLVSDLLGVNPFDQPAVEESKTLALRYLRDPVMEVRLSSAASVA